MIGMLLMGAVIFGFMWLTQPSEEQKEAKRQQQQLERAEAERRQNEIAEKNAESLLKDSLTYNDISKLRTVVQSYGKGSGNPENPTFSLSNGNLEVEMTNSSLSGNVTVGDENVSLNDVINHKISGSLYYDAVALI